MDVLQTLIDSLTFRVVTISIVYLLKIIICVLDLESFEVRCCQTMLLLHVCAAYSVISVVF